MGRWDKRAARLAEDAGEGTVIAACRVDAPGAGLEAGLRSVAGSLGARLGRVVDDAIGGDDDDGEQIEQTAVESLPDDGYAALLVTGHLVLLDADGGAPGHDLVVGRWPSSEIALVSAEEVTSMTLNVVQVSIVFGDGTSLTFHAPRQGFARDIDRFVRVLCESAGIVPPG